MTPSPVRPEHVPALVGLNAAVDHWTSPLDREGMERLVADSDVALQMGDGRAVLLAYGSDTSRQNANVDWLRGALSGPFLYVDRVVVAEGLRGRGSATALYAALEAHARARGYPALAAEVYLRPANPASHAFHLARGFRALGDAERGAKRIRYYAKPLAPPHPSD